MKKKLKHISNQELIKELQTRFKEKIVNRKELLELASINWCLECQGNRDIETNGYC